VSQVNTPNQTNARYKIYNETYLFIQGIPVRLPGTRFKARNCILEPCPQGNFLIQGDPVEYLSSQGQYFSSHYSRKLLISINFTLVFSTDLNYELYQFQRSRSLRTSVTMSGTQKSRKQFKIVWTYWHDHSLESSWGALSDGTIGFPIQLFFGGKIAFSEFFTKHLSL
jgi:hypothetical protein